jgi:hypothetical protein
MATTIRQKKKEKLRRVGYELEKNENPLSAQEDSMVQFGKSYTQKMAKTLLGCSCRRTLDSQQSTQGYVGGH